MRTRDTVYPVVHRTTEEIAAITGLSVSQVHQALMTARQKLREGLRGEWER